MPAAKFPLLKHPNGQWYKGVKGRRYYFGAIADDPKGTAAIAEYDQRLPGILAGTDHLRRLAVASGGMVCGELMGKYVAACRVSLTAGTLAGKTFADYCKELKWFNDWIKDGTPVASLKPEHFGGYVKHLIEVRKLQAHARKRVIASIKSMFRWGAGNGLFTLPNFGTAFKAPSTTKQAIRMEKQRAGVVDYGAVIATGVMIDSLLALSQPNMKAIILMGINCGLGPADIGRLKWRHIQGRKLDYPRGKTGNMRHGFLWKETLEALERVKKLKHTREAFEREGGEALVFITKKRQPYYRETEVIENGKVVDIKIANAVSITFCRTAKKAKLPGVSYYRLRHTFKTLGKRAKDGDALDLCMGHQTNSVKEGYDHEKELGLIAFSRIRRVALKVKHRLWPKPKTVKADPATAPIQPMKLADAGPAESEAA